MDSFDGFSCHIDFSTKSVSENEITIWFTLANFIAENKNFDIYKIEDKNLVVRPIFMPNNLLLNIGFIETEFVHELMNELLSFISSKVESKEFTIRHLKINNFDFRCETQEFSMIEINCML